MPARPQGLFSCSPLSLCRNLSPLWRQVGSALRAPPHPRSFVWKNKALVFFGDRPLRLNCPFRVYLRALFWMACVDSPPLFPCSCLLSWNKSFRKVFRRLSRSVSAARSGMCARSLPNSSLALLLGDSSQVAALLLPWKFRRGRRRPCGSSNLLGQVFRGQKRSPAFQRPQ